MRPPWRPSAARATTTDAGFRRAGRGSAPGGPRIAGRATAEGYPGTSTVTFDDGRFDIANDGTGTYCTGCYAVTGDRVRLVAERRDSQLGCLPARFLDATFVLTDDWLAFSATTAHQSTPFSSPAGASHASTDETRRPASPDYASSSP